MKTLLVLLLSSPGVFCQTRAIDELVIAGIKAGKCPGAVVMVGRGDRVLYKKALGQRQVVPQPEALTLDTIFDLASVTKPVATGLSILTLYDQGRINLNELVGKYLPEFRGKGKEKITIRHLLTHHGGLTPDNHLRDYRDGPKKAWERICALPTLWPPGKKFKYTDVGFIVLGKLVARVSGLTLDRYADKHIFKPLGMGDTGFNPPVAKQPRIAPTQIVAGKVLRGRVHDPRARLLGGVAGHAGLFSTAADLARICRMLLNDGQLAGVRILRKGTINEMLTLPANGSTHGRGLGWDLTSAYSSPRGHWLTRGISFGHSGFTGTSIWIDPATQAWIVFLSSRCHPEGKGNVIALRRQIGSAVGRELGLHRVGTKPGIECLAQGGFKELQGAKVGLITNHSGLTRDGRSTIDLLYAAKGVQLKCLFSPEHGIRGVVEKHVADGVDAKTGLKVWSLYGKTRRPTAEMLAGVDTLVFDIQDIGARFYTYIATMRNCLEVAAERKLRFVVLDRPNPIGGHRVFGPLPDKDMESFIACDQIPLVHGMTVGELARLFNETTKPKCRLTVILAKGWQRRQWLDQTPIPWVHPSPNMRSLRAATLYPGICLMEATNVSMGRGTKIPFECFGAPWIDGVKLASALNRAKLPGVSFNALTFTPKKSKFRGQPCQGVLVKISDREALRPVTLGITIIQTLARQHRGDFNIAKVNRLLRNKKVYKQIVAGITVNRIIAEWSASLKKFQARRQRALLYK